MNVIAARLAKQSPATDGNVTVQVYREQLARPRPLSNDLVLVVAGFFLILGMLLLMLAAMNVANVLLARATVRQREMGLRAALGAGTGPVPFVRCSPKPSCLGVCGRNPGSDPGANGLTPAMSPRSLPPVSGVPVRLDFGFDWRVFAYSCRGRAFRRSCW